MLTFPCFICGNPMEVKETKTYHLHLRCLPCGVNTFVNEAEGIEKLKALCKSGDGPKVAVPHAEVATASTIVEIKALKKQMADLTKAMKDGPVRKARITRAEYEDGEGKPERITRRQYEEQGQA